MRLLKKSALEGFLHLRLDSLDDLWTLRNVLEEGDLVVADTFRTAPGATDKIRSGKMEKRAIRLGVRAKEIQWDDFSDQLRVLGPIEEGEQDHGRHHALILKPDGMDVLIRKPPPLPAWLVREVEEAVRVGQAPQLLLLAIDDSEAQFALLKGHGLQLLGSIPASGQGKRHPGAAEAKRAFYREALQSLATFRPDPRLPALVVGPGWWREEFVALVRAERPDQASSLNTEGTSQGGRTGLQEALRTGAIDRVVLGHRVQADTQAMERFLDHVARDDGLAAYGAKQVAQAVAGGQVEEVLASDRAVRSGKLSALLARGAPLRILSTAHPSGERLDQMGGVAALLRYRR
ncbi:MAG: mRNA surveillance protein pelota [Thermoplasmatota archaeon]